MDRIEREHEEFRADLRLLLTAQVIQKTQIDELLKVTQEHTRQMQEQSAQIGQHSVQMEQQGARLDSLVAAIAELIRRIPPENLR